MTRGAGAPHVRGRDLRLQGREAWALEGAGETGCRAARRMHGSSFCLPRRPMTA
eukprot:CAMPEP_0182533360 /NCGR_PEP_ID=MMETSP1323-20130603/13639_1 /TAXON_ID=236787 /ORGANISM="Florenciella parvula, Strain RCC1693" /LENGTH=53 /DNA_ID=CAMNT_0024743231 /DNA_START=128 /DNA_END=285 /DNA_ORIENTATION=-